MCQRYSFIRKKEVIKKALVYIREIPEIPVNYNICPGQTAPVILNTSPAQIQDLSWGLIPEFAKESGGRNLINARKDGIASAISFRMPVRKKRCLVLADSFYCWRQLAGYNKPYRVKLKNQKIFVMAGVWDIWQSGDGRLIKSFAIVTGPSSGKLTTLTNRSPLIFENPELQQKWLLPIPFGEVMEIINMPCQNELDYYQVPDKINSLTYNDEDLHDEVLDPQPKFTDL